MDDNRNKSLRSSQKNRTHSTNQGKNHLLVIGIDKYRHCTQLANAVSDAKALTKILENHYGFQPQNTLTLFDQEATRKAIRKSFRQIKSIINPKDNLVIYYSGHGEYDKEFDTGYWVPVEANPEDPEDFDEYLNNRDIIDLIERIDCHHLVLISDSCFSGAFFSSPTRHARMDFAYEKSRWLFSSGRKEQVLDGPAGGSSPFARHLTRVLSENQGSLLFSELANKVKISTLSSTRKFQKPRAEPLAIEGHYGGEFVFTLNKKTEQEPVETNQGTQESQPQSSAFKEPFYQEISETQDKNALPDDLGIFKDIFGDGFNFSNISKPSSKKDLRIKVQLSQKDRQQGVHKTIQYNRYQPCEDCQSTGKKRSKGSLFGKALPVCPKCLGEGRILGSEKVKVQIPPAIKPGQRLKLSGKGHQGIRGEAPGDFFIEIQ